MRDSVFRGCTGAGLLLALWYGAQHAPKATRCPHTAHAQTATKCLTRGLAEVAEHWAVILVVGLVLGGMIGVLLSQMIPRERAEAKRRGRAAIPERVRHAVWRRDRGRCVECDTKEDLEFDHIIPLSRGGSSTERNLQLLCAKCNRQKAAHI